MIEKFIGHQIAVRECSKKKLHYKRLSLFKSNFYRSGMLNRQKGSLWSHTKHKRRRRSQIKTHKYIQGVWGVSGRQKKKSFFQNKLKI